MPTHRIDTANNLAVHPDKYSDLKEAGDTGAAFVAEAQFSEATAPELASRLVDTGNNLPGAFTRSPANL